MRENTVKSLQRSLRDKSSKLELHLTNYNYLISRINADDIKLQRLPAVESNVTALEIKLLASD